MKDLTVYTCILNGYDDLMPPAIINSHFRYICFTNINLPPCPPWGYRPAYWPENLKSNRASRIPKILSHLHVDTEYSIWIDGHLQLLVDPEDLIAGHTNESDLALFQHPLRDCVYSEIALCLEEGIGDKTELIAQEASYRALCYPAQNGLWACGLIVRRHTADYALKRNYHVFVP